MPSWKAPCNSRTLLGLTLAFVALLGLVAVAENAGLADGRSGGRVGAVLADVLSRLLSPAGAFIVLAALLAVGLSSC